MSKRNYEVTAPGHTHAGVELKVGDIVELREAVAAKFPAVFKPAGAAPRPARSTEAKD